MTNLAEQTCVPCKGGVPPLEGPRTEQLLARLGSGWHVNPAGHLERSYRFDDFAQSMSFANTVADIAETEGHHPELRVGWGSCTVEIWTHKIDGLSESDFFLAAKAERAFHQRS